METKYVTKPEFKRLQGIVKVLVNVHEADLRLTAREKKLLRETEEDIKAGKWHKFSKVDDLLT